MLPPCLPSTQDYSGNSLHASPKGSPSLNGAYMELSKASSQYVEMPPALAVAFRQLNSWSFSGWVRPKTVRVQIVRPIDHVCEVGMQFQ